MTQTESANSERSTTRPWAGIGLVAWTAFVWGSRVRNILDDVELTGGGRAWRLAVAVGFVALALAGGIELARRVRPRILLALAVIGPIWWFVRGGQILLGDWSAGFKAVHTILALVVFAFSWMVLRSMRLRSAHYG